MKIANLTATTRLYTSNVYLVTGTWNAMEDVNTLIDVGRDPAVKNAILTASTGVGKKRIAQVVLTHSHYDHAEMLGAIRGLFAPVCLAYSTSMQGIDRYVRDGDVLRCGDCHCEVIHTPGHSSDSICLYCREEKVLFSGDTPLHIPSPDRTYTSDFVTVLARLARLPIEKIYPGHGDPILSGGSEILRQSLQRLMQFTGDDSRL